MSPGGRDSSCTVAKLAKKFLLTIAVPMCSYILTAWWTAVIGKCTTVFQHLSPPLQHLPLLMWKAERFAVCPRHWFSFRMPLVWLPGAFFLSTFFQPCNHGISCERAFFSTLITTFPPLTVVFLIFAAEPLTPGVGNRLGHPLHSPMSGSPVKIPRATTGVEPSGLQEPCVILVALRTAPGPHWGSLFYWKVITKPPYWHSWNCYQLNSIPGWEGISGLC